MDGWILGSVLFGVGPSREEAFSGHAMVGVGVAVACTGREGLCSVKGFYSVRGSGPWASGSGF